MTNLRLDRDRAEKLLKLLTGLAKVHTLYPEGHAAIRNAERTLAALIDDILHHEQPLLIGCDDGHLAVGDVPFLGNNPHARELVDWFAQRQIEGALIQAGAGPRELSRFCRWLRSGSPDPWAGRAIKLTRIARGDTAWNRGLQVYRAAVDAVEAAYRELEDGVLPDPAHARTTVNTLTHLWEENPIVAQGLALLKDYDRYTFHHSVNVCLLVLGMGRQLKLSASELEGIGVGSLLHDIGKTRTPSEVVRKAGSLSQEEWALIFQHPKLGREIVEQLADTPEEVALLVYEHHMRHDGGGYPTRAPGYRQQPLSPLVSAADVFDAMTSHRPYNRPMAPPDAARELRKLRGSYLQPAAVDTFLEAIGTLPVGSVIRLSSGEMAVVTRAGPNDETPQALVVRDASGTDLAPGNRYHTELSGGQDIHPVAPLGHRINPLEVLQGED